MTTSIPGTIVNGTVHLDHPVDLADQSRVQVTIVAMDDWRQRWRGALDALAELKKTSPINSGGLRYTRDQLYERD